jgi:hypothetical protein
VDNGVVSDSSTRDCAASGYATSDSAKSDSAMSEFAMSKLGRSRFGALEVLGSFVFDASARWVAVVFCDNSVLDSVSAASAPSSIMPSAINGAEASSPVYASSDAPALTSASMATALPSSTAECNAVDPFESRT